MEIHGYEVDDGEGDAWQWVLLNAPLLIDAARSDRGSWVAAQKLYSILEGRSQKGLPRLLQDIDRDVKLAYAELGSGNVEQARERLQGYGMPTLGVFDARELEGAMRHIEDFQNTDSRAGAYECHAITSEAVYLCVWIDR